MKNFFRSIGLSVIVIAGMALGLSSCLDSGSDTSPLTQLNNEISAIDDYLDANGIDAITDHRGIRMVITEMGTGLPAKFTNSIDVDYVGKLFSNNSIFDQGNVNGLLTNYIDGWKIAFSTLPVGSKATLYIPSYWGYGSNGTGSIPGNSTLVFDVVFKKVTEASQDIQRFTADTVAITDYLEANNIDAVKDTTGVSYVINELGTGPTPSWFDKVTFNYTVKLLTNDTKVVFTESVEPLEDFFSRVVYFNHGWKIALQRLPKGSKATFYMPSGLAYGTIDQKDASEAIIVPANSNVIIDLELVDVVPE
jgi:FKBP-type peptidyl-prolyl cis-trans isomerase